jgi:hypothetical protein
MRILTLLLPFVLPLAHSSSDIATGLDLLDEMSQLQRSLERLQSLLNTESVKQDEEIKKKAAKLFRRARWLIYSSSHDTSEKKEAENSSHLRGGIGSGEMTERKSIEPSREVASREAREMDTDHRQRNMYEATIMFPECRELFLEDCLQLISNELAALQMSAEVIIHEKRSADQPGYNKVVIVTDLSAEVVKGRNNDGIVSYPFMWETASGTQSLGVDGKFDCKNKSPEECCTYIQHFAPEPDIKGNYLQCHIFVPFGGVGNRKRGDRVFVNLSQDGRVQESPFVS